MEWRDWTAGALKEKAPQQNAYFSSLDADKIDLAIVNKDVPQVDALDVRDPFEQVR